MKISPVILTFVVLVIIECATSRHVKFASVSTKRSTNADEGASPAAHPKKGIMKDTATASDGNSRRHRRPRPRPRPHRHPGRFGR